MMRPKKEMRPNRVKLLLLMRTLKRVKMMLIGALNRKLLLART